jgi:hypothetical protein
MAPLSPAAAHHRAKIAGLGVGVKTGVRRPDDPELRDARRDYAAAKLNDYIMQILAEAPPLSDEQRNTLAELLRPVRRRAADDAGAALE